MLYTPCVLKTLYHNVVLSTPRLGGFELTGCIRSCKSNDHTITTMMASNNSSRIAKFTINHSTHSNISMAPNLNKKFRNKFLITCIIKVISPLKDTKSAMS